MVGETIPTFEFWKQGKLFANHITETYFDFISMPKFINIWVIYYGLQLLLSQSSMQIERHFKSYFIIQNNFDNELTTVNRHSVNIPYFWVFFDYIDYHIVFKRMWHTLFFAAFRNVLSGVSQVVGVYWAMI